MEFTDPIRKNFEFARAYKKGRYFVGKYLILYVLKRGGGQNVQSGHESGGGQNSGSGGGQDGRAARNGIGVTASKKVGKSVRRNRLRRLVKENYRQFEARLKRGYHIVFVVRSTPELPLFADIQAEMKGLFARAGILS
jgi:ribonuclease P protein component